ncbi:type II toxin-antitoxin system YafO family toxin [Vibrio parahaemolyticus]|nr:type II toxin-antitoxin system YafO family toxin [Vibrio parahaemolyticus]MDF4264752.1 type II toxin-antitoxin system YafO family toxin [Vibrio parahaemolyticus]MDF4326689.1 type II toxin-antitoxin system YafO family toxin [Vibrio parahaemolyticus]MDF4995455.1 type II toxin-antitoxin system YafO family toxin [Vibrio parahaemolyticus]MDG2555270.1 type II toxin-antitoxin system YafO family toxin [Vibrio parahaemolyticus]
MNKDVKVFVSSGFRDSLDKSKLDLLVSQFKDYKKTGVPHESFGRDTTYDFPSQVKQAGMSHIHIRDPSSKRWHLKKLSYHKTSNTALIYCEGFLNKNYFLLLGFIENAHQLCKLKPLYLMELADVAERFREKF